MPAFNVLTDVSSTRGVNTAVFCNLRPVAATTEIVQSPATVLFQLNSKVAGEPAEHVGVASVLGSPRVIEETKLLHVSAVLDSAFANRSFRVKVNERLELTGPPPKFAPDKRD